MSSDNKQKITLEVTEEQFSYIMVALKYEALRWIDFTAADHDQSIPFYECMRLAREYGEVQNDLCNQLKGAAK